MSTNPFQIQPIAPELLVGRKSEIDVIFDQIANKSHVAIYGDFDTHWQCEPNKMVDVYSLSRKVCSEQTSRKVT